MNLWNAKAAIYDGVRRLPGLRAIHHRELRHLQRLLAPGQSVDAHLDLGSGTGAALAVLPDAQRRVLADLAPAMLLRCRQRHAGAVVLLDASRQLPFAAASFDLITAIGLVEYLQQPAVLFAEAARVCRPGGRLLVTTSPPGVFTWLRAVTGTLARGLAPAEVEVSLATSGWDVVARHASLFQQQWLCVLRNATH